MARNSCIYAIAGTNTFRLSSSGITTDFINGIDKGTNLQNIEPLLRSIYTPDYGKKFIQPDQSGAEALIVAYLARPGLFRKLFDNKIKPHVFVGLHVFQKEFQEKINRQGLDIKCDLQELIETPIENLCKNAFWKSVNSMITASDEWPAEERYYFIAKQICHSSNYSIRANRFSLNTLQKSRGKIVIDIKSADRFLSTYHSLFPEIREWHRQVEYQIRETRTLYNLFGFPREFNARFEQENDFKEAFVFVPQSTVGTITNIAYTNLQTFIEDTSLDWDLLANTHDSYLVQCPTEEEYDCAKVAKGFMEQELISPRGEKFNMRSEVKTGFNWGKGMKKINL